MSRPTDPAVEAAAAGRVVAKPEQRHKRQRHGREHLARAPPPEGSRGAFFIPEFCEAHRISIAFFHKLRAQGLGPRVMSVGARVLISVEAAQEWRRGREAAAVGAE